jgi:hypothetical protein
MKKLVLLALLCMPAFAATASVAVTFTVNTLAVQDVQAYLETQISFQAGLAVAMGAADTSLTLASLPANLPTTGIMLIGSELVSYTGVSGSSVTGLTRGTTLTNAANNTTAATHAVGTPIYFLTYSGVTQWIKAIVGNQVQAVITALGTNSALIGTNESTIQSTQSTVTSALTTAVQ